MLLLYLSDMQLPQPASICTLQAGSDIQSDECRRPMLAILHPTIAKVCIPCRHNDVITEKIDKPQHEPHRLQVSRRPWRHFCFVFASSCSERISRSCSERISRSCAVPKAHLSAKIYRHQLNHMISHDIDRPLGTEENLKLRH